MIDARFQQKGLEEKALEHILRGVEIQGVKRVSLITGHADEGMKKLSLSLGFHIARELDQAVCRYELEL